MAALPASQPINGNSSSTRCRCCPYGFHIDLDFVSFAEEVARGSRAPRTPTSQHRRFDDATTRSLASPLDSIFSDSLENIVSDFEEVLDRKTQLDLENRDLLAGYLSDNTGYRTKNESISVASRFRQNRPDPVESSGRPMSASRSSHSSGARAQIQKQTAYTALGRTLSELKAKQSMETLTEASSRPTSTTPFDMDLLASTSRISSRSEHDLLQMPPKSPRLETTNLSWRRPAATSAMPAADENRPTSTSEFASLRRGRESGLPLAEGGSRIRYYSASPKLPRRLTTAADSQDLNFGYTSQQNGLTILSRHQGTSISPRSDALVPPKPPPRETKSVSVGTGPLPPAKPCIECPQLRQKLSVLAQNQANQPAKPQLSEMATCTSPRPILSDACTGADRLSQVNIGISTERAEHKDSQTTPNTSISIGVTVSPLTKEVQIDTLDLEKTQIVHSACNTEFVPPEPVESEPSKVFADGCTQFESLAVEHKASGNSTEMLNRETMTNIIYHRTFHAQTAEIETRDVGTSPVMHLLEKYVEELKEQSGAETQTEISEAQLLRELSEPRLIADAAEYAEALWTAPAVEKVEKSCGPDEPRAQVGCEICFERQNTFTRNVGVGACAVTDKCDGVIEVVDENEVPGFSPPPVEKSGSSQLTRAAATKKLLEQTTPFVRFAQKLSPTLAFRGSAVSRSLREPVRSKSNDDLEFIEQRHAKQLQKDYSPVPTSTVPSDNASDALTAQIVLKKDVQPTPPSSLPEPIPARIPRPKISKYAVAQSEAETPDEEEEAQDRLTPLRSELRVLSRWNRNQYEDSPTFKQQRERISDGEDEDEEEGIASDGSEGTYDLENDASEGTPFEVSEPLKEALNALHEHLEKPGSVSENTVVREYARPPITIQEWALKYVQHEWLKTTARKNSQPVHVELLLESLKAKSDRVVKTVVNMTDQNGNSALHYAVSHGNFAVVSCLLDCGHCELNLANKAGYTSVMLAALSSLDDAVEREVVHRLFQAGDVNARATQHGQTALMLAVSHGKIETTQLLLENGADVNIQDEEGSTALMCAAEHGHRELVKLLLAQPGINAALADCDASTALTIAVENNHGDIGVLIYAHLNYTRGDLV